MDSLVALSTACFMQDGGLHLIAEREEIIDLYFPKSPSFSSGAFNPEGKLIASAVVSLSGDSPSRRANIAGQVHPSCRTHGLCDHILRWSLQSAHSLHASSELLRLQLRTEWLNSAAHRLYVAHGFEQIDQSLIMRRDFDSPLPDYPTPTGITFTPWQPSLADEFYKAWQFAFRERPGFSGYATAPEWVESWTNDYFRQEWPMLARAGDLPAGFLLATENPPHGFVMQVGVIPSHRRRGICSAMLVKTMQYMLAGNLKSAQLTVNINNPGAIESYSRIGFSAIGRRARFERIM